MKKLGIIKAIFTRLLDRANCRWKLGHWNDSLGGAGYVLSAA